MKQISSYFRKIKVIVLISAILLCFFNIPSFASDSPKLESYGDVRGADLSALDLKDKRDLLFTLTFDNLTKWPSSDKLPNDFNPAKLLEQGKDPGLGISELQKVGYTGKGVSVAYIDQHLLLNHEAYKNVNLHNTEIQTNMLQPSMHGPAVLSLLAGKDIGIVPDAAVYYFGHNGGTDDNEYEAKAYEKIIEMNKTLPGAKKIRIIGMSHAADNSLSKVNADHLRQAQAEARKSGIIVVDVGCNMATCGVSEFKDRNNAASFQISNWEKGRENNFIASLFVPADFRTTASGYLNNNKQYIYWGNGGFSWGVPFITGVITMGLQIDPNLTEELAFKYLRASWYSYYKGGIINPKGFLKLVKDNCLNPHDVKLDKEYRYFLYNSNSVTVDDLNSINIYVGKFNDNVGNVVMDVSQYKTATMLYSALKKESSAKIGNLKGIQIFGSSKDVPSFDVHFKIQMQDAIDDSGNFKSDFFYSNFKNSETSLENDFSIYKAFNEKLQVSFVPEWVVSRLPLSKGEIAPYMQRCFEYANMVSSRPFGSIVNFSNPIFASSRQSDDMGYFIKERLDKEFKILNNSNYKLYGNLEGYYPVKTSVAGGFTKENIAKENAAGIKEFIINSHGQWNNIDQCIFTNQASTSEKRISFLNKNDINKILSTNYYDLDLWTCSNASNLDDTNLIHEAMAKGKCIGAMAASSVISNNGVDNSVSYENLKKNNFYFFYLNYINNLASGKLRSESFSMALKAYSEEILKNTNMLLNGNYQFNLHNVLSYHYLGLLEYWKVNGKANFLPTINQNDINKKDTNDSDVTISDVTISDATNSDGSINYSNGITSPELEITKFRAIKSGKDVKLILNYSYSSELPRGINMFDPPEGKIISIGTFQNGIKKGNGTVTFVASIDKLKKVKDLTVGFSNPNNSWTDWKECLYFTTDQFGNYNDLPEK